jgi:hypothetical protein
MVAGLGQGVHDQGMELPLFIHHRLHNFFSATFDVTTKRIHDGLHNVVVIEIRIARWR